MPERARTTCISFLLAVGTVLVMAAAAQAQVVRFVSTTGDDVNECTRLAPCRTLQRGVDRTPSGGEVLILNTGNYGNAATIVRSITISAVGVAVTIGPVTINAPGHSVVLRGLLLTGNSAPAFVSGIQLTAAGSVHIARCDIEHFSGNGIRIDADNAAVFISDSTVRNNGDSGILLSTISAGVQLTIDHSRFENNDFDGLRIVGTAQTTITHVVTSANGGSGVTVDFGLMNVTSTTAANNGSQGYTVGDGGQLTVESSVARGNTSAGLRVRSGSVGRIGSSVVTDNGTGLLNLAGGTLLTRGNNTVAGNTTPTSGTISPLDGM
jgi:Right handed beta helix region